MESKVISIQDKIESVTVIAIQMLSDNTRETNLLQAAGFWSSRALSSVYLLDVGTGKGTYHPGQWKPIARYGWTEIMPIAHRWLIDHWNEIETGGVLNIEQILQEGEKL